MSLANQFTVESVPLASRRQALQFWLADRDDGLVAQQVAATSGPLIWAFNDAEILGVAWAEATAASVVTIATPRLADAADPTVGFQILARLDHDVMTQSPARIAHALLDDGDRANHAFLAALDFTKLAEVDFLAAPVCPPIGRPFVTLQRSEAAEGSAFWSLVQATFQQSWDCPLWDHWCAQLGLDALHSGFTVDPNDECYFVQYEGQNVGVLITRHEAASGLEIRYLGIDPIARRRGFGRATLQRVRALAASRTHLVTAAVDRQNRPAYAAYRAASFDVFRHASLWAKQVDASAKHADRAANSSTR